MGRRSSVKRATAPHLASPARPAISARPDRRRAAYVASAWESPAWPPRSRSVSQGMLADSGSHRGPKAGAVAHRARRPRWRVRIALNPALVRIRSYSLRSEEHLGAHSKEPGHPDWGVLAIELERQFGGGISRQRQLADVFVLIALDVSREKIVVALVDRQFGSHAEPFTWRLVDRIKL